MSRRGSLFGSAVVSAERGDRKHGRVSSYDVSKHQHFDYRWKHELSLLLLFLLMDNRLNVELIEAAKSDFLHISTNLHYNMNSWYLHFLIGCLFTIPSMYSSHVSSFYSFFLLWKLLVTAHNFEKNPRKKNQQLSQSEMTDFWYQFVLYPKHLQKKPCKMKPHWKECSGIIYRGELKTWDYNIVNLNETNKRCICVINCHHFSFFGELQNCEWRHNRYNWPPALGLSAKVQDQPREGRARSFLHCCSSQCCASFC